jgi:hypothetical protein
MPIIEYGFTEYHEKHSSKSRLSAMKSRVLGLDAKPVVGDHSLSDQSPLGEQVLSDREAWDAIQFMREHAERRPNQPWFMQVTCIFAAFRQLYT